MRRLSIGEVGARRIEEELRAEVARREAKARSDHYRRLDDEKRRLNPHRPKVGEMIRDHNILGVHVMCAGLCRSNTMLTWAEAGANDETDFLSLKESFRFECRHCGCAEFTMSPDWRGHSDKLAREREARNGSVQIPPAESAED